MGLLSFEHSVRVYWADFALHGLACLGLAVGLVVHGAADVQSASYFAWWPVVAQVAMGLLLWTLAEYGLHRFVLHGLQPFSRWHALHHERPRALICGPTLLSSLLVTVLVFLPLWLLFDAASAAAVTVGVEVGYLSYGLVHHATHHWPARNAWMRERKRWHALHHHTATPGRYGVTTRFWDQVFGGAQTPQGPGLTNGLMTPQANALAVSAAGVSTGTALPTTTRGHTP